MFGLVEIFKYSILSVWSCSLKMLQKTYFIISFTFSYFTSVRARLRAQTHTHTYIYENKNKRILV